MFSNSFAEPRRNGGPYSPGVSFHVQTDRLEKLLIRQSWGKNFVKKLIVIEEVKVKVGKGARLGEDEGQLQQREGNA